MVSNKFGDEPLRNNFQHQEVQQKTFPWSVLKKSYIKCRFIHNFKRGFTVLAQRRHDIDERIMYTIVCDDKVVFFLSSHIYL